jgi:chromosome segregation ATPase
VASARPRDLRQHLICVRAGQPDTLATRFGRRAGFQTLKNMRQREILASAMRDLTPDEIAELASFLSPRDRAALFSTTQPARSQYASDAPALLADVNAVAADSRGEAERLRAQLEDCRATLQHARDAIDAYDEERRDLRDRLDAVGDAFAVTRELLTMLKREMDAVDEMPEAERDYYKMVRRTAQALQGLAG